ncbi:MAG: 2-amino-4-hydroxy-6-hydroxymethyldihydropteridine diphosphokinase [Paludibacteraceae bacterium]|nr:2-amino-4-hydroxy-6-hydroxymethyldihydropteridine diphosphokinase [Paludibacteraceae bacterium]
MDVCYTYYVSIGSNFNPEVNIRAANTLLSACFATASFSEVLRTEGIGLPYQCWYLNQMVRIQSPLDYQKMVFALKELEKQAGRKKNSRNVVLDLDIVEVDGVIVHKHYNKYPFLAQLRNTFNENTSNK